MSDAIKAQKQLVIDEIKEKFSKAKSAVIVDYLGITVEEANTMRKKLREANVDYSIYKNTMVKRAIEGSDFAPLVDDLKGPSAFAFSYDDPTSSARVINESIKELKKMAFKAGIVEGVYYDHEGMTEIAAIPSREVLIAKFMGSIQSPVSKFVRTLQAVSDAKTE